MRIRALRTTITAAIVATGLLIPSGTIAAPPVPMPFIATVDGCSYSGSGSAPDQIVQRSASGAKKATFTPSTSSLSWYVVCTKPALVPGDTLTFLDLADPLHPAVIQKVTIPSFTAVTDRKLKRVTGVAKGAPSLAVQLQECRYTFAAGCDVKDDGDLPTGAGGAYTYAPAKPITGLWQTVVSRVTRGVNLLLFARFPRLVTHLGSAAVDGIASPGQSVTVQVDRAGEAAATVSTKGSPYRSFKGKVKANGSARTLAVGDRVRWYLAGKLQGDFTIPAISFTVAPSHTFGHCIPDGTVMITATKPDRSTSTLSAGTTAGDGSFDVSINISSGWNVLVECRTKLGDGVQMTGVAGT